MSNSKFFCLKKKKKRRTSKLEMVKSALISFKGSLWFRFYLFISLYLNETKSTLSSQLVHISVCMLFFSLTKKNYFKWCQKENTPYQKKKKKKSTMQNSTCYESNICYSSLKQTLGKNYVSTSNQQLQQDMIAKIRWYPLQYVRA